jgi:formylmethanofuran dehydrogenase subunit A
LDVYENLTKVNEYLRLPHSLHAHIEGYETEQGKKNLTQILTNLESFDINPEPKDALNSSRSQFFHLAHASSYNTDGDNRELIDHVNNSTKIDLDIGFVGFNPINPLITSDKRLINNKVIKSASESKSNLIQSAVESEGDFYVSVRKLSKNNKQHCIMWLNSINLALNIKNKWQIQFSLNFPNYGDVKNIPDIATWLLSSEARNKFMEGMNLDGIPDSFQAVSNSELTFNDFVIITRSSPAKSLGIGNIKGNLGIGADGDLNVLDVNITDLDCSKDYLELKKSLSKIDYVVKSGITIQNKDKVRLDLDGKIYWANRESETREKDYLLSKTQEFYTKYYSVYYDSYKVSVDDSLLRQL